MCSATPELDHCAAGVGAIVDSVLAQLDEVDTAARGVWERAGKSGARTDDLVDCVATLHRYLRERDSDLIGAGVVFAPGTLADADLAVEWWYWSTAGELVRMNVVLDPRSELFYDYPTMPWFAQTRDHQRPTVIGPFVDLHGTGLTSLTFSRPLVVDGEFRGVTTGDVALTRFERKVRAHLKGVGEAVVVNEENRVVASNTPQWTPGTLIRGNVAMDDRFEVVGVPSSAVSWTIINSVATREPSRGRAGS